MQNWQQCKQTKVTKNNPIAIKHGIFQGNPLRVLTFRLATNSPLSTLNQYRHDYQIRSHTAETCTICHLLFVKNRRQLNQLIKIVELFTTNIGIKYGMDKCHTLNIRCLKVVLEGFETGKISSRKKLTTELATKLQKPFKTNLNSKSLTIWRLPKCTVKVILQYLRKIQWYISVSVVQNYN